MQHPDHRQFIKRGAELRLARAAARSSSAGTPELSMEDAVRPNMALHLLSSTCRATWNFLWSASPRFWGFLKGTLVAGAISVAIYNTQAGGMLFEMGVDITENHIVSDYYQDILPQEMPDEEKLQELMVNINWWASRASWLTTDNARIAFVNAQVRRVDDMTNGDSEAMKDAALEGQFLRITSYGGMYFFRDVILRQTHENMRDSDRDRILAQALVDDIVEDSNNLSRLEGHTVTQEDIESYLVRHPEVLDQIPSVFDRQEDGETVNALKNGLDQIFPELAPPPPPVETEWQVTGPVIVQGADGYGGYYRDYPIRNMCVSEQTHYEFFNEPETFIGRTIRIAQHATFQGWCEGAIRREENLRIGVTFEEAALSPMPQPGAHFDLDQYFDDMGNDMGEDEIALSVPHQPANDGRALPDVAEFRERAQQRTEQVRERATEVIDQAGPAAVDYVWCIGSMGSTGGYTGCLARQALNND